MTAVDHFNAASRRLPPAVLYICGGLWALWLFWLAVQGHLGVDPAKVLEHRYGKLALQSLIATLAITPLRRIAGVNLLRFRRALGVMSFVFALLHLLVWLLLDVQILAQVWADILKRPYVTLGMAGFVLMVPLALTSNNRSVRRLGAGWRQLHRLTYGVAGFTALHFILLTKGFQWEPLIYAGAILLLLVLRLPWAAELARRPRRSRL